MTVVQIEEEKEARNLKNRQAARNCRARKKQHTQILEAQVDALATKNRQNQWIIRELLAKVKAYEISINR